METEGHPSEHNSSPFIWFYLRPLVPTRMIGVHNPLLFLQLQPHLKRRRLFSRWFIFQGKPFLSPTLLSCPQLALAHFYGFFCSLIAAPHSTVLMCLSTSAEPGPALLDNQDEVPSVTQDGFSAFDCLILHFFEGDSFPKLPASPLPSLLGWRGMQLYG